MEPTEADLKELKRILAFGSTPYIEGVLKAEISRLSQLLAEPVADGSSAAPAPPPTPAPTPPAAPPKRAGPRRLYEGISSYAFSDSSEVAKIIISDIEGLSGATIEFTPTERAFSITVLRDGQGLSNLRLTVDPLKKIVPSGSRYVVRGRTLTVLLSKKKKGTWTKLKKTTSGIKKPKANEPKPKEDSNTALMDMMKKMYDEGDDDMKRTMQKAWWEAQHKKDEDKDKDKDKKDD
jgi:calcyclin binding protein